ncbi:MAG: hypothetical protein IJX80_06720 [Clostridia bacterium]|nr:hypothetical protein [Clostridia bacterium]
MNNSFDHQQISFEPVPPSNETSAVGRGFAIASLVCGIVGILMCCCCVYLFNLILGVLAVVFAIVSARMSKKMSGLAIAGLILGILALIIFIALFAFEVWISNLSAEEFDALIGNAIKDIFGEEYYDLYMDEMGFGDPLQ